MPTQPSSTPLHPSTVTHLQTDRYIHPAAKCGADGAWWEPQVFEDLWEGLGKCYARPLLCYHHACTYTRQVHISQLKVEKKKNCAIWIRWRKNLKTWHFCLNLKRQTDPQRLRLRTQALGAHLHDWVRAEGDSHFILTDCSEPERRIALQLQRRDQDRLVAWVDAETEIDVTEKCQWKHADEKKSFHQLLTKGLQLYLHRHQRAKPRPQ